MKKIFVLTTLFIVPVVAYLFFASGVHQFAKLPILNHELGSITSFKNLNQQSEHLYGKITILGFFGSQLHLRKGAAFNLNQKIYNKNHLFSDFQFLIVVPFGTEPAVKRFLEDLSVVTDTHNWKFVFGTGQEIQHFHYSLDAPHPLDANWGSDYVYIIDKEAKLRGRDGTIGADQDIKFGYDMTSVSELSSVMSDDVKVILAEYRLALKKYKSMFKKNAN